MKNIVLAASAVLLFAAPSLSFAQDDHHGDGGHPGGGRPAGGAPTGRAPGAPPPQGHMAPATSAAPQVQNAPASGQIGGQGYHGGQPYHGGPGYPLQPGVQHGGYPQGAAPGGYRPQGPNIPGGQGGYRPQPGQPGLQGGYRNGQGFASPGYNGGPGRAGAQAFGYSGRQYFRYHASPYAYPRGYYGWANHSWRRGEWLPPVFIASDYFIDDWYDFGLWRPDYGYEWVRVGADAILVNLASGQVVDVVPGVYYY